MSFACTPEFILVALVVVPQFHHSHSASLLWLDLASVDCVSVIPFLG